MATRPAGSKRSTPPASCCAQARWSCSAPRQGMRPWRCGAAAARGARRSFSWRRRGGAHEVRERQAPQHPRRHPRVGAGVGLSRGSQAGRIARPAPTPRPAPDTSPRPPAAPPPPPQAVNGNHTYALAYAVDSLLVEAVMLVVRDGSMVGFSALGAEGRMVAPGGGEQLQLSMRTPATWGSTEAWQHRDDGALVNVRRPHVLLGFTPLHVTALPTLQLQLAEEHWGKQVCRAGSKRLRALQAVARRSSAARPDRCPPCRCLRPSRAARTWSRRCCQRSAAARHGRPRSSAKAGRWPAPSSWRLRPGARACDGRQRRRRRRAHCASCRLRWQRRMLASRQERELAPQGAWLARCMCALWIAEPAHPAGCKLLAARRARRRARWAATAACRRAGSSARAARGARAAPGGAARAAVACQECRAARAARGARQATPLAADHEGVHQGEIRGDRASLV